MTVLVSVPRFASAGERHAVVWAEVAAPGTSGVRLVNRVGIRLYLTVGTGGGSPASFKIGELHAERAAGGAPVVRAMLRNTGARTLAITGSLTLSNGPGGTTAGPFPTTLIPALSPGGSAGVYRQLDSRLPRGPWRARLRLHSGRVEREAVATLNFGLPRKQPAAVGTNGAGPRTFRAHSSCSRSSAGPPWCVSPRMSSSVCAAAGLRPSELGVRPLLTNPVRMKRAELNSRLLILVTLALVAFGLVMVYSATSAAAAVGGRTRATTSSARASTRRSGSC